MYFYPQTYDFLCRKSQRINKTTKDPGTKSYQSKIIGNKLKIKILLPYYQ